ncbi:hypothetical protein U1Q18_023208 [Sarracenia purpurea var. burkii]
MALPVPYIKVGSSLPLILALTCAMFSGASSDATKDREVCTQQLVGLSTCLPYVGGDAKGPTPDCCAGLKQVLKSNKTCLCVIIRDRNDPDLGLTINVTLALRLPSVCNSPANVSQCPELLHLAPNSTDAQVFYQLGHSSNNSASGPVASGQGNPTSAGSTGSTTGQEKSGSDCIGKRGRLRLKVNIITGGVLMWLFYFTLIPI